MTLVKAGALAESVAGLDAREPNLELEEPSPSGNFLRKRKIPGRGGLII